LTLHIFFFQGNTNDYYYTVPCNDDLPPASGWKLASELVSSSVCHSGVEGPAPELTVAGDTRSTDVGDGGAIEETKGAAVHVPEGGVLVVGAGSDLSNGVYERAADYNGKWYGKNAATGLEIWWNHGQWRIGNTNDYWYCAVSDEALPPDGGWLVASEVCSENLCHDGVEGPGPTISTY
jgi:hypothetical protein